jgi:hypothetical protein
MTEIRKFSGKNKTVTLIHLIFVNHNTPQFLTIKFRLSSKACGWIKIYLIMHDTTLSSDKKCYLFSLYIQTLLTCYSKKVTNAY